MPCWRQGKRAAPDPERRGFAVSVSWRGWRCCARLADRDLRETAHVPYVIGNCRHLVEDLFGPLSEIERHDLQLCAEMDNLVWLRLGFAGRVDQQSTRKVGRYGVGEGLVKIGVDRAVALRALVLDVPNERAGWSFPPRDVGIEPDLSAPGLAQTGISHRRGKKRQFKCHYSATVRGRASGALSSRPVPGFVDGSGESRPALGHKMVTTWSWDGLEIWANLDTRGGRGRDEARIRTRAARTAQPGWTLRAG